MDAARNAYAPVQLLLEAGAEKDLSDNDGQTALMDASLNAHAAVVQLLLDAGAQIDVRNHAGKTAMTLASEREVLRLLEPEPTAPEHPGSPKICS